MRILVTPLLSKFLKVVFNREFAVPTVVANVTNAPSVVICETPALLKIIKQSAISHSIQGIRSQALRYMLATHASIFSQASFTLDPPELSTPKEINIILLTS